MFGHFHEISTQEILFGKDVDAREMTDFLMIVEAKKLLGLEVPVDPHDVPVLRFFRSFNDPSKFLCSHFNDLVLGLRDVDDNLVFGDVFHAVFDEFGKVRDFVFLRRSLLVVASVIIAIGHVIFITWVNYFVYFSFLMINKICPFKEINFCSLDSLLNPINSVLWIHLFSALNNSSRLAHKISHFCFLFWFSCICLKIIFYWFKVIS